MKIVPINEELLVHISGCMANDRKSQAYIYKKYASRMYALCMRYARTTAEAEDILQMGFVKIFTRIQLFTGRGSFEGWMKQVMVNTALDTYNANQRRIATTSINDLYTFHGSSSNIDAQIETEFLLDCLRRLPEHYRMPFNMHIIEGYSHREIADKLGISVEQSRINVSRARQKLRANLKQIEATNCCATVA